MTCEKYVSRELHREDGLCWCDDSVAREFALDRLYPDRCTILGSPGAPNAGLRHCVLTASHEQPCHCGLNRPDAPCHFCGDRYDTELCGNCWTSLEGMGLADLKAVFAGIDLSLEVSPEGPQQ